MALVASVSWGGTPPPEHHLSLRGQPIPIYAQSADPAQFNAPADVAVLHYYGSGGWGIQWRKNYLLTAPYFSNHDLAKLTASHATGWAKVALPVQANEAAVIAGFEGTPVGKANAILVGHGHVDHIGDVPAFFEHHLITGKPALIADRSVVNQLISLSWRFSCLAPIDYGDADEAKQCPLEGVRITPIHHAHAPHVNVIGLDVAAFGGVVKDPQKSLPSKADDYKLGNVWAYLIDLLDEKGAVAFRISYVDAASGPPHALVPKALLAERDVDLHIACVPGFEQSDNYPDALIEHDHVRYVLLGHWEDFFQPRSAPLAPLRQVLSPAAMERFVDIVEKKLPKSRGVSPVHEPATPHGASWALPVPGQTFQFATAR